jgi:hypothetical protein
MLLVVISANSILKRLLGTSQSLITKLFTPEPNKKITLKIKEMKGSKWFGIFRIWTPVWTNKRSKRLSFSTVSTLLRSVRLED